MFDFQELSIGLPDGYPAYARYWPAISELKGAVLYLHGIQSHCGWYEKSARYLQQAGYAVLQPDRRGSGRNQKSRGHADNAQQLIADGFCCGEYLRRETGLEQFHLLGISWGGKLAAAMYVCHHQPIGGLILVCPGFFPRIDVSAVEKVRIGLSMMGDSRRLFNIPLNDPELFTSTPYWIEFLRWDPWMLRQVSASFFLAGRRMDAMIQTLAQCPPVGLYLLVSGQDRIVDSPQTVEFIRGLGWPKVQVTEYPDARHTFEFEAVLDDYCSNLVRWVDGFPRASQLNPSPINEKR